MNPTAAILSIGNEVLRGSVVNTNAAFLGAELTGEGFEVVSHGVCADTREAIRFRLEETLRRADVIIVMGGLGPTPDDVTREGIAAYFRVPLVFSKTQYACMRKMYKKYGKRIPALVRREAYYPANARPLINRFGVALGFSIEIGKKLVVVLPGVPAELRNMYFHVVLPLLHRRFPRLRRARRLVAKLTGISEPDVMKKLGNDFFDEPFDFGIYPSSGEVTVRILARETAVMSRVQRKIASRLSDFVYAWEEVSLAAVVGRILGKKRQTLALAESCTGGALAAEITRCPGASRFFRGGTVVYHAEAKKRLGVREKTLRARGEVSREVAGELAREVRNGMGVHYGIGITGIAGPGGGSRVKPVGLVYIGIAGIAGKSRVWRHVFWGDREQVRRRAAIKALEHLWRTIR
ncbi:MAG: CinA family nicotinamide mononucleotide deamidase-related protein [Candidatus Omnitrophica bacterium]|nr:CinA family nicotinamide mononucleotide deamidase-related protein [Candidatus Omnitrophota bacterium]